MLETKKNMFKQASHLGTKKNDEALKFYLY